MPLILTFDINEITPLERNRIQAGFERFGWENLGGSSYRYPKLGTDDQPVEDWFNHVIPALTLFRTYIVKNNRVLSKFTLDVQSSTGANSATGYGSQPLSANSMRLYEPTHSAHFGEKKLINWIDSINYPYEYVVDTEQSNSEE